MCVCVFVCICIYCFDVYYPPLHLDPADQNSFVSTEAALIKTARGRFSLTVLCWSPSHTCIKGQSPPQRQSRILGARSEAVRISSLILLTAITHPAFFFFFFAQRFAAFKRTWVFRLCGTASQPMNRSKTPHGFISLSCCRSLSQVRGNKCRNQALHTPPLSNCMDIRKLPAIVNVTLSFWNCVYHLKLHFASYYYQMP